MKILGVQFKSKEGQVQKNVTRAIELIRALVKNKPVDLVLLPELFTSGYCGTQLKTDAESKEGDSVTAFSELARELDVVVGFGFVEDSGRGKPYNSYALIEPNKPVYSYHKTHLHVSRPGARFNEPEYFLAGDSLGLVNTRLGRIGIMICYDGYFPEVARCLVLSGAQTILWPSRGGGSFAELNMVSLRARENMVPVINVDGSQSDEESDVAAHSIITDHEGNILSRYKGNEGFVFADINPAQAKKARDESVDIWAMYRVRHPELYKPITEL